ncbi:MAG: decaprenyl-phosphate phosphoribosyltransferase [Nocardioidaceae bacterium]
MSEALTRRSSSVPAVVRAARPRQWVKNVLVLAAPVLGGQIGDADVLISAAIAFVAFCCAASGIYYINDVRDIEEDRAHPIKRFRPIPAGEVATRLAVVTGSGLLLAGLAVSLAANWELFAVIATYEAVSLFYCFALKDEPVIDIAIIASGFLLRAVAGGVAAEIELSQWFLLAASFGSLFMAAGKRYAEVLMAGPGEAATRRSLSRYSESYLRFVWSVSAGILIMTYGLWAFEIRAETGTPWAAISMAPFVLAVLRYAVDVDAGRAGEPEEIALSDRVLQALALIWLILLAVAVYSS